MNQAAKQYLESVRRLEERADQRRIELELIDRDMKQIERYGGPVPGEMTSLRQEVQQERTQFIHDRNSIIEQIQGMENETYRVFLYKRYVEYKNLEPISMEMHYEFNYIRQLHSIAVQAFGRCYGIGE